MLQVILPVPGRGIHQFIHRIEHSQLHVGMDPVDHGHAPVGEIEEYGVLVGDPGRPHHPPGGAVEPEDFLRIHQSMKADPPRCIRSRGGEVGVGHVPGASWSAHLLHTGVFVRPHAVIGPACQNTIELVATAVFGAEQEDVGAIVEEPSSTRGVGPVPGSYTAGEEMESIIRVNHARIEYRPIAGHGVGTHDRLRAEALRGHVGGDSSWVCHTGHAGRMRLSVDGFTGICSLKIGRMKSC